MTQRQKDAFFQKMNDEFLALTYDDVRLRTNYSDIDPAEVDFSTKFSRNVPLHIPIVAAAMDTVTERKLAIAIAMVGGLGVIHRNLSPDKQAAEAMAVKDHLSPKVTNPKTVFHDDRLEIILQQVEKNQWGFNTFPVLNRASGKLVGLLTKNDFDLCDDYQKVAQEVMTPFKDLITGGPNTSIQEAYEIMQKSHKKVLPLVDDGKIVGMYLSSDIQRVLGPGSSKYNLDKNDRLRVGAAVGVGEIAIERAKKLIEVGVDVLVIDSAHFDTPLAAETLKTLKKITSIDVVAGNISEASSAKRAAELGADGIKIGQGPGSICTTRIVAGIGCPQVSAVYNCAFVAEDYGIPINADGGIRYPGDIPIAIGAGADSVMVGGVLASAEEAPGKTIEIQGVKYKPYRGMGSKSAMDDSFESRNRYGQDNIPDNERVPEGIETRVLLAGKTVEILSEYIGGLRKGMWYTGTRNIQELKAKAMFWRITNAGQTESHPHANSYQTKK